jgi:hypothetical protein
MFYSKSNQCPGFKFLIGFNLKLSKNVGLSVNSDSDLGTTGQDNIV